MIKENTKDRKKTTNASIECERMRCVEEEHKLIVARRNWIDGGIILHKEPKKKTVNVKKKALLLSFLQFSL